MKNDAKRYEDMSRHGQLRLYRQEDGDIIISVIQDPQARVSAMPCVEFCSPGAGGGQSRHTRAALVQLMEAIWLDNEETPQYRAGE